MEEFEGDRISLTMGHELLIPRDVLQEARNVGDFSSTDFQLDGVFAVTDEGEHSLNPVPVRPGMEWRMYGTPSIGLKWRQVPVDASEKFEGKLDPASLLMQERLTRRAYDAYGRDVQQQEVLAKEEFLVADRDMGLEQSRRFHNSSVLGATGASDILEHLANPEQVAAKRIQAALRRSLMAPLYPWYHVMRLVSLQPPGPNKKDKARRQSTNRGGRGGAGTPHAANPPPSLPWCRCWMSLEPTHELDSKSFDLMQQVVFDFEDNQLETCLRRIDNVILWRRRAQRGGGGRRPRRATDEVLVELAALCNRFGLKLYFMGRQASSHAFYQRVLEMCRMGSGVETGHNPEIYAWTCDIVAFCLWHQGKHAEAHFALSRSVHPTVPTNTRVVSRLHAALLLLQQGKHDLSLKLASTLLVELLQQRHEHALAVHGSGLSEAVFDDGEILRIIEYKHEQSAQPSAPAYVNLLCHAALTVAYGLSHKGRYKDAVTVVNAIQGQLRGGAPGVSRDLKEVVPKFLSWLQQVQQDLLNPKTHNVMPSAAPQPAAGVSGKGGTTLPGVPRTAGSSASQKPPFRAGAVSAEPFLEGTSRRSAGLDASWANNSSRSSVRDGRIFSGSVAFEASEERAWAADFFGDVYWQRHHAANSSYA